MKTKKTIIFGRNSASGFIHKSIQIETIRSKHTTVSRRSYGGIVSYIHTCKYCNSESDTYDNQGPCVSIKVNDIFLGNLKLPDLARLPK